MRCNCQNTIREVELKPCHKEQVSHFEPSGYTNRGLDDYVNYQPRFLSFDSILESVGFGKVLEVGSGNGKTLLELKARHPHIQAYGTNLIGYGLAQINGSEDSLWSIAGYYNLTVYCDAQNTPAFPNIIETAGIQSPDFGKEMELGNFDFIFSRHSLNYGKLKPEESFAFIPRLLPLLKEGSLAMTHILGNTFMESSNNKYHDILGVHNIVDKSKSATESNRVSVVLYQSLCFPTKFCIGVLFKKCPRTARLHPRYQDCIVPHGVSYLYPPAGWLVGELAAKAAQPNLTWSQQNDFSYNHKYMVTLLGMLEAWEAKGMIFHPSARDAT